MTDTSGRKAPSDDRHSEQSVARMIWLAEDFRKPRSPHYRSSFSEDLRIPKETDDPSRGVVA